MRRYPQTRKLAEKLYPTLRRGSVGRLEGKRVSAGLANLAAWEAEADADRNGGFYDFCLCMQEFNL